MSDAALMEATRLAPAGRACSKFIWQQCRFQKNWAVRVLPRSGRPAFLLFRNYGEADRGPAPSWSLTSNLGRPRDLSSRKVRDASALSSRADNDAPIV